MAVVKTTIGYPIDGEGNRVLLFYKKRGFGAGKYNGFGGKLEPGESFEQCLIREAQEELGITPVSFKKVADLHFYDSGKLAIHSKAYVIDEWVGWPQESEEGRPEWFHLRSLPFDKMWDDDVHWLGHALSRRELEAHFHFEGLFTESPRLFSHEVKLLG